MEIIRYKRLLVALMATAMLSAACGDDDTSGESTDAVEDAGSTDDTADGDTADGDTADGDTADEESTAGGDSTTDDTADGDPIKLVLLWEIGGESDVAVDDFQNGAEIALASINDAGGVDGRPVEAVRIAANPLDPQHTNAALAAARDENPTAMVGLIVNSQAAAAISQIEQAETPLVMVAQADDSVINGGASGSDWLWAAQPYSPSIAGVTIDYLVTDLGYEKIGLLGTSDQFGQTLIDASKDQLATHDLEAFAERTYPGNATDLTEQVRAMDGADVAVNWAYPNPLAVQLQQFAQNGIEIQTYDGPSAPIVVQYGMAAGELLENLHATLPCNAGDPTTDEMQAFVDAYTDAHGAGPSFSAVSAHDAVLFAAAAIANASDVTPAAVNEAMASTEITAACGAYAPDGAHVLHHGATIVDYAADGSSTTVKEVDLPMTDAAG